MTVNKIRDSARDLELELYAVMLKIRFAEQRIISIYPTDKIQSPIHLCIGQEAVAAGVCRALRCSDRLYGTYRGHGIYIAKGGDLGRMFAELYGRDTGCARGKGGSMHLAAPEVGLVGCSAIVASLIPVATGDALAARMQGNDRVVCAFFGDGAVDEGVFFESVNFAVLKGLPIVYVCENNGYAVHSPVSDRHKQDKLYRLAEGLGLRGTRHDGNDAMAVFRAMSRAMESARRGGGPALLEYTTNRWYEHVGTDTDYNETYRNPADSSEATKNDPIKRAAARLKRRGLGRELAAVETAVRDEIDRAVAFAEISPFRSLEPLHADLIEAEA